MTIIVGSDHGGVDLKRQLIEFLNDAGHRVKDMGVDSSEAADYPDVAAKTCFEFNAGNYDFGILVCGTGIGISMAANKIDGIRCTPVWDIFSSEMAKAHNNANFVAFGGRIKYAVPITAMLTVFMETGFEGVTPQGDRHVRRVEKIAALERAVRDRLV